LEAFLESDSEETSESDEDLEALLESDSEETSESDEDLEAFLKSDSEETSESEEDLEAFLKRDSEDSEESEEVLASLEESETDASVVSDVDLEAFLNAESEEDSLLEEASAEDALSFNSEQEIEADFGVDLESEREPVVTEPSSLEHMAEEHQMVITPEQLQQMYGARIEALAIDLTHEILGELLPGLLENAIREELERLHQG
ncbi:MAG: hypothetical protein H7832_00540, partial [Magnetococcus sp. DMHC-6]